MDVLRTLLPVLLMIGIGLLCRRKNLISRELKKKYRQSMLGYVWCVLNPLLIMLILTLVFSQIFNRSIENFPVYLCAGRLMFCFVTESASSMLTSIAEMPCVHSVQELIS